MCITDSVRGNCEVDARVAVQDCTFRAPAAHAFPSGFEKGILLGVQAEALVERFADATHVALHCRGRRSHLVRAREPDRARRIGRALFAPTVSVRIAPPATSLAAVPDPSRRAVISGTDDALVPDEDGSDSALHAV